MMCLVLLITSRPQVAVDECCLASCRLRRLATCTQSCLLSSRRDLMTIRESTWKWILSMTRRLLTRTTRDREPDWWRQRPKARARKQSGEATVYHYAVRHRRGSHRHLPEKGLLKSSFDAADGSIANAGNAKSSLLRASSARDSSMWVKS